MKSTINSISINEDFWSLFTDHLISFRIGNMQNDIHCSVAFNKDPPDINFHFTRNIGKEENKPKIEIFRVSKTDLENMGPHMAIQALNFILQPLNLRSDRRPRKNNYYRIYFAPFETEETENFYPVLNSTLKQKFKPLMKVKNKRLKIKGDLNKTITQFASEPLVTNELKQKLIQLPRNIQGKACGGYITSKKFTGTAICINNKWYSVRKGIKPKALLSAFLGSRLAEQIIFKTLIAFARIGKLNSWEDSKPVSRPLKLKIENNRFIEK